MPRKSDAQHRAEKWGTPVPPNLKHGTKTWAADVYGCGCALCLPSGKRHATTPTRTSWERKLARRSQLWGTPVPAGVEHGNSRPARVIYGCECTVCLPSGKRQHRDGRGKWQRDLRQREQVWGGPVPDHLKHGPNKRAARIYGCDCTVCLPSGKRCAPKGAGLSKAERAKRLRIAKKGQPVPEGTKHGPYAYKIYGCRCDVCRASTSTVRKRRRDRAPEGRQRIGHWTRHVERGLDIIHWPAVNTEPWACPECGEKIGVP